MIRLITQQGLGAGLVTSSFATFLASRVLFFVPSFDDTKSSWKINIWRP